MDCVRELDLLIRSRYPIIYLRTNEEERAANMLANIARAQHKRLVEWSSTEGLRTIEGPREGERPDEQSRQPLAALEIIQQDSGRTIYLMKSLHPFLDDPSILRKLRDLYESTKRSYKTILLVSPVKKIPADLEKAIYFLNMPLPDVEMLKRLLKEIVTNLATDTRVTIDLTEPIYDRMANAALGLTLEEAERVFFKAIVRDSKLAGDDVGFVRDEKRQIVQKSGLLEYYETGEDMGSWAD